MATASWYGKAFISSFSKRVDVTSDTIKCALFTSSYTPNVDTDEYYDSLTGETSGQGYTAGGATISNPTVNYNATTNTFYIDGGDVQWTSASFTFRYAVVYDATPATNKPLLCYVDFGQNITVTNGTLQIQWSSDGIAKVTLS